LKLYGRLVEAQIRMVVLGHRLLSGGGLWLGVVQRMADGGELPIQITGTGVVPAGATAVALNLTAADPTSDGYVKVYPCGGTPPVVSNVNYRAHQVAAANLAVVKLPPDGRVCFSSYAATDLVVDLAGWFVG
jgi:hypothetical protein